MLNPNKYIRKAYIDAIKAETGLNVWHKRIPKDVVMPLRYILLDSQTKQETVKAKTDYYEWLCTLDVQIFNVNEKGYSNGAAVDDIEESIIEVIRGGVAVSNFYNKETQILESIDLDVETVDKSIDRRVIKFEHWLNFVDI